VSQLRPRLTFQAPGRPQAEESLGQRGSQAAAICLSIRRIVASCSDVGTGGLLLPAHGDFFQIREEGGKAVKNPCQIGSIVVMAFGAAQCTASHTTDALRTRSAALLGHIFLAWAPPSSWS